jgi:hypothetical protein
MFPRSLVLAAVAVGACSDSISPEELAGTYSATSFTVVRDGVSTDVLEAGGSLTIVLASSGTTSGTLVVPASVTEEEPINASMAGTFTLEDDVITFVQAEDTFVRDVDWIADGDTIVGTGTFGTETISVTLEK